MTKIIFEFDKEKNHWNVWDAINNDSNFQTKNEILKKICYGKSFDDSKKELENYYNVGTYDSKIINKIPIIIQNIWETIEDTYFERLNRIIEINNKIDEIRSQLTTIMRAPYNPKENSFMFSINNSIPHILKSCGHEIMHIYFHNSKYWNLCEDKIGKQKTHMLKEALTVLLNLEFRDLWIVEDKGYLSHKKLRKFIEIKWKENPDFESLIDECIKKLK